MESVTRLHERMIHVIPQKIALVVRSDAILWMTKTFEKPEVFNERVTKSGEWFDVSSGRVTKLFRRLTNGL